MLNQSKAQVSNIQVLICYHSCSSKFTRKISLVDFLHEQIKICIRKYGDVFSEKTFIYHFWIFISHNSAFTSTNGSNKCIVLNNERKNYNHWQIKHFIGKIINFRVVIVTPLHIINPYQFVYLFIDLSIQFNLSQVISSPVLAYVPRRQT